MHKLFSNLTVVTATAAALMSVACNKSDQNSAESSARESELVTIATGSTPTSNAAKAGPLLKPGLWAMKITLPDNSVFSRLDCVVDQRDLTTEMLIQVRACKDPIYSSKTGMWKFNAQCTTYDDEAAAVEVLFTGDFQSSVQASGRIVRITKSGEVTHSPSLVGKWKQTCEPGKYYGTGGNGNG